MSYITENAPMPQELVTLVIRDYTPEELAMIAEWKKHNKITVCATEYSNTPVQGTRREGER